jgi:ABC-type transport system substrate-binding protein
LGPRTTSAAKAQWRSGNYDLFITGMTYSPEPSRTMNQVYLSGDQLAPPPQELVDLAERGRLAPFGSDEREAVYQEMSAWLQANPVHVLLNQARYTIAAGPDVIMPETPMKLSISDIEFRRIGIAAD